MSTLCPRSGKGLVARGVALVALFRWQRCETLGVVDPLSLTANAERLEGLCVQPPEQALADPERSRAGGKTCDALNPSEAARGARIDALKAARGAEGTCSPCKPLSDAARGARIDALKADRGAESPCSL